MVLTIITKGFTLGKHSLQNDLMFMLGKNDDHRVRHHTTSSYNTNRWLLRNDYITHTSKMLSIKASNIKKAHTQRIKGNLCDMA